MLFFRNIDGWMMPEIRTLMWRHGRASFEVVCVDWTALNT